ncbi:MAG TPA: PP2C family serine/threonine-protein phosphatase [Blastocatellia bacterium]|nr:PP2C family serine/threonine-protein phosphatase [Blastocatellia bacterium]
MKTIMTRAAREILVSVSGYTDAGKRQRRNEDSFLVANLIAEGYELPFYLSEQSLSRRGMLFVVADGMGGAVAGEVASAAAVTRLHETMAALPDEVAAGEQLRRATESANENIWALAQENPALRGMGSTLTAVFVKDGVAYLSQVGDSRAYLIRGDKIRQLTRDQSLVQLLIDIGDVTPEEAPSHPKRKVILQALGAQPKVRAEMTMVELCRGDYLILCSDGLSNYVTPPEIHEIAVRSPDRETACWRLIDLANAHGGEDDMTVVVARFDGERLPSANSKTITASMHKIERLRQGGARC